MRRLFVLTCLPVLILGTGSCGLLDSGAEIRVEIPVQEFDFTLDAGLVKTQLQQYLNDQGISVNISGLSELPQEVAGVPLTIQQSFDLAPDPQQVDLSDQEELQKYIQAGKVKSVKIQYVQADVASNTLNFATPEIELYMDQLDATGITASSSKVAVIPSIAAGQSGVFDLAFEPGGRDIMSNFLLDYQFSLMALISITIDTSVTRTIPDGILQGKLLISLYFTVDPL